MHTLEIKNVLATDGSRVDRVEQYESLGEAEKALYVHAAIRFPRATNIPLDEKKCIDEYFKLVPDEGWIIY